MSFWDYDSQRGKESSKKKAKDQKKNWNLQGATENLTEKLS